MTSSRVPKIEQRAQQREMRISDRGAGLLRSHLCNGVLGEAYSAIAADNLLSESLSNIEHFRNEA
jgi:hypothetical protein